MKKSSILLIVLLIVILVIAGLIVWASFVSRLFMEGLLGGLESILGA